MKYKIADFKIDCEATLLQTARDLLADAAGDIGFEAFEETDEGLRGFIQSHLFEDQLLQETLNHFPLENTKITFQITDAEDKNWNEEWENSGFEPIDIEGKIVIYDAKTGYQPTSPDIIAIGIDARQAFGTGNHPTTRMMLTSLLQTNLQDKRVLDCGCGTGILSIASYKFGAKQSVGYDIDEWCVENTEHNMEINGIENPEVLLGDVNVLSHVCGLFDVVLANINRNILLNDMPQFKEMMNGSSILIISGFFESDIELILERASSLGLHEMKRMVKDEWCCLTLG